MDSATIRKTFLDFFSERGHTVVESSPLVPDDPTLLFTSAGMVQFKPFFEGAKEPSYPRPRATSAQKCLRAVDLEEVGKDARHLSFFEMLGSFSFGDYFKKEAIAWAWELTTEVFRLDPGRMWATVFETDEEAAGHWLKETQVPAERILRVPTDFWDMGVAGPCGPCSHLYCDRGEQYGREFTGTGEMDEDRYFEIYNLVFIQNMRDDAGAVVGDLPKKNVDLGMGLERIATVLQEVPTIFDIDTLGSLVSVAESLVGKKYGEHPAIDVALRVLAEHSRGVAFALSDGVLPSNEERGYVLRRLIRRAVRYARLAGVDEPVLKPLVEKTIEIYSDAYPELARNRDVARRVIEREESSFDETLRQGLGTLETEIANATKRGSKTLSGSVVFKLHDTYGFPLDLTKEIAAEAGLEVEMEEFASLMKSQRERARAARSVAGTAEGGSEVLEQLLSLGSKTDFVGYERASAEAQVLGVVIEEGSQSALVEGEAGELVLDVSPFYPEGGGQVGDRGEIRTHSGVFVVEDTRWGPPGLIVHRGKVASGEIRRGEDASASVNPAHREGVRQSHTATHMVHWALQHFLGEHARQKGSLVEPGRMRFDFSHFEAIAPERLDELEEEVNRRVLFDDSVRAFETTYEFAMSIGAMALFGEKYGDFVRVVEVGDYSKELCGGTHVAHTGQVGVIKFISESSVGAGVRRIDVYTGLAGLKYLNEQSERLRKLALMLKVDPDRVEEKVQRLVDTSQQIQARLSQQRAAQDKEEIRSILDSAAIKDVGGEKVLLLRRDGREMDEVRRFARALRDELGSGVVVIGSAREAAAQLVAAVSKDIVDRGISARDLLIAGASVLGGRAGGGDDLATAGGPNGSEIDKAMSEVEAALRSALEA